MNNLPRDKQIEIIGALCEGVGQRAVSRLTETDRKTVARLALAIGRGCAELHDRQMVGLRVHRIECDELWAYVGHKRNPQKGPKRRPSPVMGDQYTYVALASSTRAIIGYVLRQDGHNATKAAHLLKQFEPLQAMHIAGRDRLRAEAAAILEKDAARRRER